jgi:hypothetical protein
MKNLFTSFYENFVGLFIGFLFDEGNHLPDRNMSVKLFVLRILVSNSLICGPFIDDNVRFSSAKRPTRMPNHELLEMIKDEIQQTNSIRETEPG